jgi:hypothetical protein
VNASTWATATASALGYPRAIWGADVRKGDAILIPGLTWNVRPDDFLEGTIISDVTRHAVDSTAIARRFILATSDGEVHCTYGDGYPMFRRDPEEVAS